MRAQVIAALIAALWSTAAPAAELKLSRAFVNALRQDPDTIGTKPFDDFRRITVLDAAHDLRALESAALPDSKAWYEPGKPGRRIYEKKTPGIEQWVFSIDAQGTPTMALHLTNATVPGHYAMQIDVLCTGERACKTGRALAERWLLPAPGYPFDAQAQDQWNWVVAHEPCEPGRSSMPIPPYPEDGTLDGVSGTARLVLRANRCGIVRDVTFSQSSRSRTMDVYLRDHVLAWRMPAGPFVGVLPVTMNWDLP